MLVFRIKFFFLFLLKELTQVFELMVWIHHVFLDSFEKISLAIQLRKSVGSYFRNCLWEAAWDFCFTFCLNFVVNRGLHLELLLST